MSIEEMVKEKATSYCNSVPELSNKEIPELLIDFVIEKFRERRCYPSNFTNEKIENDLSRHLSIISMAVVDLFGKVGTEGMTHYTESGITITYEDAYISSSVFDTVFPYINAI